MKPTTLLFFLFYALTSKAQSPTTTLKISIGNCRDSQIYVWKGLDTINIYKLPEDTLCITLLRKNNLRMPITLKGIPIATYDIHYKNIFGQQFYRQIQLADQETNTITLCSQELLEYPQNTLAKLQNNDSICIAYFSQGCFHTTSQRLVFIKKGSNIIAKLYNTSWFPISKEKKTQSKDIKLIHQTILTNAHIQQFIRFENELPFVTGAGCTTTDEYVITSKYWNIKKRDESCNWNGYRYLIKSLFGTY